MDVEFKVFQSDKGVQAAEVSSVGGEPLMVEPKGKGKGKGKGQGKGKGTPAGENGSGRKSIKFSVPKTSAEGRSSLVSAKGGLRPASAKGRPSFVLAEERPSLLFARDESSLESAKASFASAIRGSSLTPAKRGPSLPSASGGPSSVFANDGSTLPSARASFASAIGGPSLGSASGGPSSAFAKERSSSASARASFTSAIGESSFASAEGGPSLPRAGVAFDSYRPDGPIRISWPDADEVPAVRKTIQKPGRFQKGTQSFQQSGKGSHSMPQVGLSDPMLDFGGNLSSTLPAPMLGLGGFADTASAVLFQDAAFHGASVEDQAAALEIMEHAMAQAAIAQATMEQAKALVHGSLRNRGAAALADAFGGSVLNSGRRNLPQDEFAQAVSQAQAMAQGNKKAKKVPCRFFAQFRCAKGNDCEFSHDAEMFLPRSLEQKTPLACTFYEQGRCSRGDACPFAHGQEELIAIEQVKGRGRVGSEGFATD